MWRQLRVANQDIDFLMCERGKNAACITDLKNSVGAKAAQHAVDDAARV